MRQHLGVFAASGVGAVLVAVAMVAPTFAAIDFSTAISTATSSTLSDFTSAMLLVAAVTIGIAAVRLIYRRVLGLVR